MKVKEYLQALGISEGSCINLTFNVARYDAMLRDMRYHTTPIRTVWEWKNSPVMNDIVLNTKSVHMSWLSGVDWNHAINSNQIMSLLVVQRDELLKNYNEKQADELEQFITSKIMQEIESGNNPWNQNK